MRANDLEGGMERVCYNCDHWHTDNGNFGICDVDLTKLTTDPEVLKLAMTGDRDTCGQWVKWKEW